MLKKVLAIAALLVLTTTGVAKAQDYPPGANSLTINVSTAATGGSITITARTFAANANVTFRIFSDPVTLGTSTANNAGVASLTTTIPTGLAAGSHRVEASGTGVNGQALTVSSNITVTKDGSSIPRTGSNDTVPYATAGIAALAVGGLFLLLAKRRRTAHAAA